MRPSRRAPDELRPVTLERGVVKYAEGSCLVKFGDTHVLVTATLEDRLPPWLKGQGRGWVTAEYGMLPRATLERTRLLIIDDWGPEPLNTEQRRDLLEIVEDRYEKGSLLVTSQIPVSRWHELIADPTIGDAILDRVIHRAHRIELNGPSLRKRRSVSVPGDSAAASKG